jgi:hypothetical protein
VTTLQRTQADRPVPTSRPTPAPHRPRAPRPFDRGLVRRGGLVAAVAVTVLGMTQTTSPGRLSTTLPHNLGDPALVTWILAWQSHAVVHDPGSWFDGNMFFPHGQALGYSELLLPLVPVFGVVYGLTGNPVLAHNVVLLGLLGLAMGATFALGRRLGLGAVSAYLAAVAFTFGAFTYAHLGHLQLLTLGLFPLGVLALLRLHHRRRTVDGVVSGVATAALVTACLYYGVIWAVWLAAAAAVVVGVEWRRRRTDLVRPLGAAGATAGVLLAPVALLLARFQRQADFSRPLSDSGGFAVGDLLAPAPGSYLYEAAAGAMYQRSMAIEHTFFPGFVVLALALVGVAGLIAGPLGRRGWWRDRAAGPSPAELGWLVLAGGALASLLIAVGPSAFGLPAPFRLLYHVVPGFDSIRVPARLLVPALLFGALAAGRGVDRLAASLGWSRAALGAVALALTVAELAAPFARVDARPPEVVAARYAAVAQLPPGSVVELPAAGTRSGGDGVLAESARLLFTIGDWRPRFNGTSGGVPPDYFDQADVLNTFPAPEALSLAADLGLDLVVLHVGQGDDPFAFGADEAAHRLASLPGGFAVIEVPGGYVVDLTALTGP